MTDLEGLLPALRRSSISKHCPIHCGLTPFCATTLAKSSWMQQQSRSSPGLESSTPRYYIFSLPGLVPNIFSLRIVVAWHQAALSIAILGCLPQGAVQLLATAHRQRPLPGPPDAHLPDLSPPQMSCQPAFLKSLSLPSIEKQPQSILGRSDSSSLSHARHK